MSLFTMFIGLLIVSILAILVRFLWLELYILWTVLRGLFYIGTGAMVSAIVWMIFVENYQSGPISRFWTTWFFFFVTYLIMTAVFYFIISDIYVYFRGFIRYLFRK